MWQSSRCPEIWHQMALCWSVPGDNRDRSGCITTHYLLIILVWSVDPAVCVSGWRREPVAPGIPENPPRFPHSPLGMEGEISRVEEEAEEQVGKGPDIPVLWNTPQLI
ncbi:hypothetical protein XENOCAPTIV_007776, partial [Xenoophorus captivus]